MIETFEDLDGIGPQKAEALRKQGFQTIDDLRTANEERLAAADGIGSGIAQRIKEQVGEAPATTTARASATMGTTPKVTPQEWSVTRPQAEHLAEMTRLNPDEMIGRPALDIRDQLDDLVDTELLFSREICGRVVKHDPETGEYHPVPNATVHVEDTDCSFLGYFPSETPYGWLFPFDCSREEIATTKTDACGEFCVHIPRWDIDRILRFRRDRICLPDLVKPRIRDILENPRVFPEPVFPPRPRPRPDPAPPFESRLELGAPGRFERMSELVGRDVTARLELTPERRTFGESRGELDELLNRPAFPEPIMPPLPEEFRRANWDDLLERLDPDVPINPETFRQVDPDRFIGPFLRCRDVIVPEWISLLDVPDISFRVTQDVDRDGDEEKIYGEGLFEVRWDADSFDDLRLEASENAISVPFCDDGLIPEDPECTEPSIETVGLMPARSPYLDVNTGYARRVNRPKPNGNRPEAETPFAGTLQLHGCHRFEEVEYYRMLYSHEGNDETAFTGQEWYVPAIGRDPVHVQPDDSEGWYPVLDVDHLETYYGETLSGNPLVFPYWILNWNTRRFANGKYTVQVQLGDANKNEVDRSDPVSFVVDNRRPTISITTIEWRAASGGGGWNDISDSCPVIRRPGGTDIHIRVAYSVSATHLRNLRVSASGCQSNPTVVNPSPTSGTPNQYGYWHQSVSDNAKAGTVTFEVPGGSGYPEGAYRIALHANSRAFNPAGSGGGPGPANWMIDPVYIDAHTSRGIAIIDT